MMAKSITDADAFKEWVAIMGFKSQTETARSLQVHRNTIVNYETGKQPVPYVVKLAMRALRHNMEPWK